MNFKDDNFQSFSYEAKHTSALQMLSVLRLILYLFRPPRYIYRLRNVPNYFHINYRTEMKLVPIIMDLCLLQFDALNSLLGMCLHGGSLLNFNFFNVNSQNFLRNRNVHL